MRKWIDSDVFGEFINKNNTVLGKINMILTGSDGTIFLNDLLLPEIHRKITLKKRDKMSSMIEGAIANKTILLAYNTPDKRLTSIVPFAVYKQNGQQRVLVNMGELVNEVKMPDGTIEYSIDNTINKVYTLLYAAYLAVDKFANNYVVSPKSAAYAACLWADMFNAPLYSSVGLNNPDRKIAYEYFSIKFFLIYFLEYNDVQAEKVALSCIDGKKNMLIVDMESKLEERQIDLFHQGVGKYIYYLTDNEISGITGMRVNNIQDTLNVTSYINQFQNRYSKNALLSLCGFPYFIYVILSAYSKTNQMTDRSFTRIFKDYKKEVGLLLTDIIKE